MRVGDCGTVLTYQLRNQQDSSVVDLSDATTLVLEFLRPDASTISKTPTIKTPPGTDGRITYTIPQGMITQAGFWSVRATVSKTDARWTSTRAYFEVTA